MNIRPKFITAICVSAIFFSSFSAFPPAHTLELSGLLYRFSYSEEFDDNYYGNYVIGRPRSDEYGATFGGEMAYNFWHTQSNLTFGIKLGYSRAINHTYDGSLQTDTMTVNNALWFINEPKMVKNKNNYFYDATAKIGFLVNKTNGRILFEPKISFSFNAWDRPVGYTEMYYWMHISPAVSMATKNKDNIGFLSQIGLLIPAWEKMVLDDGRQNYDFEIGGKIGWNFDLGLVRYLKEGNTLKIVYFYENYGFKESPFVEEMDAIEPASSTHNHGVKFTFEKGFGS